MQEIATGFDVHAYTAKVITDAGQAYNTSGGKGTSLLLPFSGLVVGAEAKLKLHTTNILMKSIKA